jgi:hypothetical protein
VNPTETAFRWRGTHQSKVGPICPVCHTPLPTHFVFDRPYDKNGSIRAVRNGQTSAPCFPVGRR